MHGTMAPHARRDVVDGGELLLTYNPENPSEYIQVAPD